MHDRQIIARIKDFLRGEGIELCAAIPYRECEERENAPRLLHFTPKSAVMLAVPYYVKPEETRNISIYAAPCDYHLYFRELFDRLYADISTLTTEFIVAGYADHSPIFEVGAAARAGIGMIGENGLLITQKFGSYVFLGEILTDADCGRGELSEIRRCSGCGLCRLNCPSPSACLSAVTQKKGMLTDDEAVLIKAGKTVWGCDICQSVCPHNIGIAETEIPFFHENLEYIVTADSLDAMSDEAFAARAYAWRGRETIKRNAGLSEK